MSLVAFDGPLVDLLNFIDCVRRGPGKELPLEARLVRLVDRLDAETAGAAGVEEVRTSSSSGVIGLCSIGEGRDGTATLSSFLELALRDYCPRLAYGAAL